jgi:hypothetical protein
MRKLLAHAVMVVAVVGCGLSSGCQGRSRDREGALTLVKAIQEGDEKRAKELASYCWVPLLESEDRLHFGNETYLPIHVAAQQGRAAVLEEMIRKGGRRRCPGFVGVHAGRVHPQGGSGPAASGAARVPPAAGAEGG